MKVLTIRALAVVLPVLGLAFSTGAIVWGT
jgi:hypothetical protein